MKNILFFGGGNIAQALISGLLLNGMSNKNVFFVDRNCLLYTSDAADES